MEYKLGQMIDHFRKARSLTMDELGEMLGKTTSTVSRWVIVSYRHIIFKKFLINCQKTLDSTSIL